MAASYSSFLTTQYYSPVFNTALFDGPFRFYFSQSYESVALKIYHLMQTQNFELWSQVKKWSEATKKHIFILVYPSFADVEMAFQENDHKDLSLQNDILRARLWEEGLIIGFAQCSDDGQFQKIYDLTIQQVQAFLSTPEAQDVLQF